MNSDFHKCSICGLYHPKPYGADCSLLAVTLGEAFAAGRAYQSGKDLHLIQACSMCPYEKYVVCRDALREAGKGE